MGRPTKLTKEKHAEIVALIGAGNFADVACEAVGIGTTTFYRWMERGELETKGRYRDFRDAVKEASALAEVRHLENVRKAGGDNWQASAWWLERRFPKKYGRRTLEVMGEGGGPVQSEQMVWDVSKMTDEQIEKLLERMGEREG